MQEQSAKFQYLTAFVANLLTIAFGIAEGWTSPTIVLLTSEETPLRSGVINMDEASWIASLLCLGCFFGNILFGYITNKFGRKWTLIIITIPTIISWLLIYFATNVFYLYAARLLNGFVGGAGYVIMPLFLSEIANDRVRGVLVSSLVLTENFGILIAFVMGNYCDFYMTPKCVIVLTILFAVLMIFVPESPTFLVKQNKISDAEKSIRFYQNFRGASTDSKLIEYEIEKLKSNVNHTQNEKNNRNSMKWSDLTTPNVRRAMIIGLVLVSLNQFSGCVAMIAYTATIFQEAGSYMSPNNSAQIVGIIQVLGTIIATNLVDRVGRKFLFAVSNVGTAIGLTTLGTYMLLKSWDVPVEAFNWLPVITFSFVIFVAAIGIFTIPVIVLSEIMPEKVKDFCMSICMSLLWLFSFITIKYLPFMMDTIGFHGSMYIFAGVCVVCEIFIIFHVPETKGKNYDEIMDSLR